MVHQSNHRPLTITFANCIHVAHDGLNSCIPLDRVLFPTFF